MKPAREMDRIVPKEYEKYIDMFAEACDAKNELILIIRFQKIISSIVDQARKEGEARGIPKGLLEAVGIIKKELEDFNKAGERSKTYHPTQDSIYCTILNTLKCNVDLIKQAAEKLD